MKKRFIDDVRAQGEYIVDACDRLARIEDCRQAFHSGEIATLSLNIGNETFSQIALKADGKAVFADEIFDLLELQARRAIDEAICSAQTFLEVESAE